MGNEAVRAWFALIPYESGRLTMRKPRVLIIAAPFGFGPAAKSLIFARGLEDVAEVTFSADCDAYDFIARHKPPGMDCVRGPLPDLSPHRRSLSDFDCAISVNHIPAVQHLARLGLASRTIFHDSLLSWRKAEAEVEARMGLHSRLRACLVQDYPGAAGLLDRRAADVVALTAPLMWPLACEPSDGHRRSVVLHLGGITSRLAKWDEIAEPIGKLVSHVCRVFGRHGLAVAVVGSAHLKTLPLSEQNVHVLGDLSPEATARLIARGRLLVTTPGIGAIYEAMANDTPLVLLPPMNSTQLHHYRVLTMHGIPGSMPAEIVHRLVADAGKLGWEGQTLLCHRLLRVPSASLTADLPGIASGALAEVAAGDVEGSPVQAQRRLFGSLSRVSAIDVVRDILSSTPTPVRLRVVEDAPDRDGRVGIEQHLLRLPKVELHVHLEGSIRPEILLRLGERHKIALPFSAPDQYYKRCTFSNFGDFAKTLLLGVRCLRGPEDFFDLVIDIGHGLTRQSVRYAEITWTPQFYLGSRFALDDILGAMNEARRELNAQSGLDLRWIPDLVRSYPAPAAAIANWAASRTAAGVVALGLGGPEAAHPAPAFAAHFGQARARGLPANPHAGEGAGPESVWQTIEHLHPARIGHGVRAIEDERLVAFLAREAIPLEVCLTSNVKLGVYRSLAEHPVKRLIDAGCTVTLNSDDPVLFQTTLTDEYIHAVRECGLTLEEVKATILASLRASYLAEDKKHSMQIEFEREFSRLDGGGDPGRN